MIICPHWIDLLSGYQVLGSFLGGSTEGVARVVAWAIGGGSGAMPIAGSEGGGVD
jgi:hypothetical protein